MNRNAVENRLSNNQVDSIQIPPDLVTKLINLVISLEDQIGHPDGGASELRRVEPSAANVGLRFAAEILPEEPFQMADPVRAVVGGRGHRRSEVRVTRFRHFVTGFSTNSTRSVNKTD